MRHVRGPLARIATSDGFCDGLCVTERKEGQMVSRALTESNSRREPERVGCLRDPAWHHSLEKLRHPRVGVLATVIILSKFVEHTRRLAPDLAHGVA